MCTHVTDTKELTGFLENILNTKKSGTSGSSGKIHNQGTQVQACAKNGKQENDIDAFLAMIQQINQ